MVKFRHNATKINKYVKLETMEHTQRSSRRTLLIGLGAAVGLIMLIALVAFVVFNSTRRDDSPSTTKDATSSQVATKDELNDNLDELNDKIKETKTNQDAARAALNDGEKQVKVGN